MPAKRKKRMWLPSPSKKNNASPLASTTKAELERRVQEHIDARLTPSIILPKPDEEVQFGYRTGYYTKWYRHFFYIMEQCRYPPGRGYIAETAEFGVARIECIGNNDFNIAYFRHTGQWWTLREELTLDEVIDMLKTEPVLQPV